MQGYGERPSGEDTSASTRKRLREGLGLGGLRKKDVSRGGVSE
jgi:hypothetical protein